MQPIRTLLATITFLSCAIPALAAGEPTKPGGIPPKVEPGVKACAPGAGAEGQKSAMAVSGDVEPGPPGAAISTSRSNIKRPGVVMAAPDVKAEPPGATVNTSRSNIKRPGVVMAASDGADRCANSAMQEVSTTR